MGSVSWSRTNNKPRQLTTTSWLLWSVVLLSSWWWLSVRAQQGRYQGQEVWSLLRDHYGDQNGSLIGFSLQVFFYDNVDLLHRKVKNMESTGQLHDLCRYVTSESCRRTSGDENSRFLFIVQALNDKCCTSAVTTSSTRVDGMWGGWGRWSACSVTCGQGTRSRSRQCDRPPPSGRGLYCAGDGEQSQRCQAAVCSSTVPPVVHGVWGGWGRWSACSVTCGQGIRSRSRQCDRPPPSGGVQDCAGDSFQRELCQAGVTCNPTVPPVVHGMWGGWGRWSACSVTCGQGTRSRSRQCDNPPPSGGGQFCAGDGFQGQQCQAVGCRSTVPPVVQGMWGGWGRWSACSVTCGQGTRSRSRHCDNPPPTDGGQDCAGDGIQAQQCQAVACPPEGRQCSRTRYDLGGRVMGGSTAPRGRYPWLVHLVIGGTIRCAGVIVDTLHVLTAGHCLSERIQNGILINNDLEVIAGNYRRSLTLESNAQRISVLHGIRHHNYNPLYLTNDVAVLSLAEPLQFNDDVSSVCLPSKTDTLPSTCTVAGWGALSYSNNFPQQLQHVELNVYDNTTCQRMFNSITSYDISQFLMGGVMCAANGTSGGKDSCRGDSGSGLMCMATDAQGSYYKLFGLVSSGFGCGRQGQPGYYAYLPFYRNWITKAINLL